MATGTLREETLEMDKEIGAVIKRERKTLGISQGKLAEEIGVTFQQIQKYETGRNRVATSTFILIANALGMSARGLFELVMAEVSAA